MKALKAQKNIGLKWVLILSLWLGWSTSAQAQTSDAWFGRDKALHFGFSAIIASGGYGVSAFFVERPLHRALIGGGLSLLAGIGKEVLDLMGFGSPSWRDLAWDVIGMTTGVLFALLIDWIVRKARGKPSAFISPPSPGQAPYSIPLVTF